jgi:DNA-binding IscR family transcriptional regulator
VLSNRLREQLSLQIMYLVGYNHMHNRDPWRLDQLIEQLDLPDEPVSRMLNVLVNGKFLVENIEDSGTSYLPMHDVDSIRLADILTAVRNAGESRFLSIDQLTPVTAVDRLMAEIHASNETLLGARTLKDLVLSAEHEDGSVDLLPAASR